MLILLQGIRRILGREEYGRRDDGAVAVDVAPTPFLLHLRVGVVVVGAERTLVGVEGLDRPAAQVVDEAPQPVLGVGDSHAPRVVVASYRPLGSGLLGLLGAEEDVVAHHDAAAVDAAPAAFLLGGGHAVVPGVDDRDAELTLDIFTGLNNLEVDSILNSTYDEYFGLTQSEVDTLLEYYDLSNKHDINLIKQV